MVLLALLFNFISYYHYCYDYMIGNVKPLRHIYEMNYF